MNRLAPERTVLLALSRLEPACDAQALLAGPGQTIDWTLLFQTACTHGVAALLCHSLLKMPAGLLPEGMAQVCRVHLQQQESANLALADQLTGTMAALDAIGIRAIPFKGPTLAMSAYGDIALRSFRDLDFLIDAEQIESCLDKLRELGYAHEWHLSPRQWQAFLRYAGQDILFGQGVPFEPHWAFAPRTLALDIDYAGLRQRAVPASFNGQTLLQLAPEDELIVLCVHGCKEKWHQLKWVVDVAEFVRSHPALDCSGVIGRAEAQGVARMVRMGLGISGRLVNAQIPAALLAWAETDAYAADWSEKAAATFFDPAPAANASVYQLCWFHWQMRERIGDRLRYLMRTLTRPRAQHFSDIAIPEPLFFLYTPYKVLHDYLALPIWLWFKSNRGRAGLNSAAVNGNAHAPR